MSAVCRTWHDAIREVPALVRSLPLLYFTNVVAPVAFCTWCDGVCHHLHLEKDALEGRFFVSHDGSWMMLMINDEDNVPTYTTRGPASGSHYLMTWCFITVRTPSLSRSR